MQEHHIYLCVYVHIHPDKVRGRARVKVSCHESARCAELEVPFRMQRYITIII